ncbi:MAG: hypothetical protein EAX81_08005, partial [Candidatus Thorarchaeota archaeon]|nr:hypothetical protein [Candidatus Thorarchaeota archaeon]
PRHFYGPLWVRIQRSDKIQKKRGNLKCAIKVAQFEGEGDKDYKSRHEKLLARMKRLAGIAQN